MPDLTNSQNKTVPVEPSLHGGSHGIANCWHGIIEKVVSPGDGAACHVTRINVEVKSMIDLMSHYNHDTKL